MLRVKSQTICLLILQFLGTWTFGQTDPYGRKVDFNQIAPQLLDECQVPMKRSPICDRIIEQKKRVEQVAEILISEVGLRKYKDTIGTLASIGINKRVSIPLYQSPQFDLNLSYEIIPDVYYLQFSMPFPEKNGGHFFKDSKY